MRESPSGRVVVVTGVGKPLGLGLEVCRQLGARGDTVYLTYRDAARAEAHASRLAALGYDVRHAQLDVTDPVSIAALAARVEAECGRLDVLINNAAAAGQMGETSAAADLEKTKAVFDAVLFGSWRMLQAFLPLLRKSAHGRVVNVSSGAGSHGDPVYGLASGNPIGPSYSIAKAALNAFTNLFATEERAVSGVLINAVCPDLTATWEGGEAVGARPVGEGAASIIWAADLPDGGPSGGFFRDGKPLPW